MSPVLLLSATFEPLKVISWQNAVSMFFLGKVEVIEEYDHDIRSVSLAIKAPAVVRLIRYFRQGRKSPPLSRVNIFARDHFACQYCGIGLQPKEATLDHLQPKSRGGRTSWENIVCCCAACNRKKGGRTPKEARMALLNKPIKPAWLPVLHIKLHGRVPDSWYIFLEPTAKRAGG